MEDKTPPRRSSKAPPSEEESAEKERAAGDAPNGDEAEERPDPVEEASMDSFPASDPPSYEPLRAGDPAEEPEPAQRPEHPKDK